MLAHERHAFQHGSHGMRLIFSDAEEVLWQMEVRHTQRQSSIDSAYAKQKAGKSDKVELSGFKREKKG
jgi:hypothetical protein